MFLVALSRHWTCKQLRLCLTHDAADLTDASNMSLLSVDRCNVADMINNLPCIIAALLENRQALQALPVIALLEWLAQHIWADLPATLAVRLQRAQALTQLGLLAEAASVLGALMQV